jgi:hypothetical protein
MQVAPQSGARSATKLETHLLLLLREAHGAAGRWFN